jgi:hypothetical protein
MFHGNICRADIIIDDESAQPKRLLIGRRSQWSQPNAAIRGKTAIERASQGVLAVFQISTLVTIC